MLAMFGSPPQVALKRRWPGVLLSLLVPGFGLLRAGLPRRAVAWFVGLLLGSLVAGICFALSAVPVAVVALAFGSMIIAQIWMLCDSFRPGRMTLPLWLLFAGLLLAGFFLPNPASLFAGAFRQPSGSMESTLMGERSATGADHVIVDRLSYRFASPKRGDLLVFGTSQIPGIPRPPNAQDDEVHFIKRVVGLPGERIRIADGKVFANGRPLGEAEGIPASLIYSVPKNIPSSAKRDGEDFIVGQNEYFTLGDNSSNSFDSRYWGCVASLAIWGKVSMIYYPFSRLGRLD